jgi:hypothetical protein
MVEYEVSNGIGTFDGERVGVKGIEEPFIFLRDEGAGFLVSPEL